MLRQPNEMILFCQMVQEIKLSDFTLEEWSTILAGSEPVILSPVAPARLELSLLAV